MAQSGLGRERVRCGLAAGRGFFPRTVPNPVENRVRHGRGRCSGNPAWGLWLDEPLQLARKTPPRPVRASGLRSQRNPDFIGQWPGWQRCGYLHHCQWTKPRAFCRAPQRLGRLAACGQQTAGCGAANGQQAPSTGRAAVRQGQTKTFSHLLESIKRELLALVTQSFQI